jgi:hypothetical protein
MALVMQFAARALLRARSATNQDPKLSCGEGCALALGEPS